MQGTVKEFSEETRSGSVLLDDGTEIPIAPAAFSQSGLRKLQFGQRVRFEVEGEGDARRVSQITIVTLR
jgi:cold shock CspA family protein